MKKVLLLILVIWAFLRPPLLAQNYNMSSSSVSTCGGAFYDNGGPAGNYSNSQFLQFTACAGQPLNQLQVSFSSFNLESGNDFLHIYNGSNTTAPLLGIFTGTVNPGIFTSSNGCLTFVFISNSSINASGWVAAFSCLSTVPPPCSVAGCPPGGSPPLNDSCYNATNLGALPAPANCPDGTGNTLGIAGTTSCANPENPFLQQQGCLTGNNMPAPAADVWYTFSITGSVLNVQIHGMTSPSAALWQGTGCGNLIGRGCAIGNSGNLNTTFQALAPGQYYLQISGGGPTDQCNFTLLLKNNKDCDACTIASNIVANPPPINGTYESGQTVTFCYTVSSFNQTSANWLHGIVPQFGSGWDMTTLNNIQPANSCSGSGAWSWYNNAIISSATGTVAGPGFFYETWQGNAAGITDNNPGNNYGDNNASSNCTWTFCWAITTKTSINCTQGGDLSMNVVSYGDGQTGSWSSVACTTDPPAVSYASLQCCNIPTVTSTSPICGGLADGTATGTGQGTGPWTYSWYAGNVLIQSSPNSSGPATISGLIPGNYTFTTTDANGCSSSAYFTITSPTSLNVNFTKTNASCSVNDGTATATVNGGSDPYTYLWSTGATTASINNLGPGIVTVTATDANGCSVVASTNIDQPSAPILNITSTNVNCFGDTNGTASVTLIGGTAPFSYLWSNANTTASMNNLAAANYSVTVTDANGCMVTASTTVTQPETGISASITMLTLAACNNATGSATVTASGGTAPYFYSWSNGANTSTATGLDAGNVSVTVTDLSGCSASASGSIAMVLPPVATISAQSDPGCFGENNGTATVSVSGGAAPYTYNWSSGNTNATAANLMAGNYSVTVTDAGGCTSTITVTLNDPLPLNVSIDNQSNVSCFGANDGTVTINVTGGTGSYNYNWSSGSTASSSNNLSSGNYLVTVTDANGCTAVQQFLILEPDAISLIATSTNVLCNGGNNGTATVTAVGGGGNYLYNWSSGSTTSSIADLFPGLYTVTVTDQNGCSEAASLNIIEPLPITLNTSGNVTICPGQSTTLSASATGGSGALNYLWNNNISASTITVSPAVPSSYSVIATDENGCQSVPVVVQVNYYPEINASIGSIPMMCSGDIIDMNAIVSGGDGGPYSYLWSSGQTTAAINAGPITTGIVYSVTVTDGCGSTAISSVNIPVETLPVISFTPDKSEGCGHLLVNFINNSQGSPGSTYAWNFGDNTFGSDMNPVKNYQKEGIYDVTLTITSPLGCTSSATITEAVKVFPVPVSAFTYSPKGEISMLNSRISFLDLSQGVDYWHWDFGDGKGTSSKQNPQYTYKEFGSYLVSLITLNSEGCSDTSYQKVKVEENFAVYFPNSFTPDDNGINDYFYAYGEGIRTFDMKIYDRWGKLVFKADSQQIPWNGKFFNSGSDCPVGVYVYSVIVTDPVGKPHSFKGTLNLIR